MRNTLAIALGLAVLALTALVITLALNHQHLREARTELVKANEQLVRNRDVADQLEQTIVEPESRTRCGKQGSHRTQGKFGQVNLRRRSTA